MPSKLKKYRKLTFADAQAIRAAREQNPALSLADLAAKFGVTPMSVSRVLRGEVHRKERERKLTAQEVQELRYLAQVGAKTQEELAKRFGLTQGEVSRVASGMIYADVPTSNRERALIEAINQAYDDLLASIPRENSLDGSGHGRNSRLSLAPQSAKETFGRSKP